MSVAEKKIQQTSVLLAENDKKRGSSQCFHFLYFRQPIYFLQLLIQYLLQSNFPLHSSDSAAVHISLQRLIKITKILYILSRLLFERESTEYQDLDGSGCLISLWSNVNAQENGNFLELQCLVGSGGLVLYVGLECSQKIKLVSFSNEWDHGEKNYSTYRE